MSRTILTLFVFAFLAVCNLCADAVNLASNKPAFQSSQDNSFEAARAVNGNFNDFTHTSHFGVKWWRVDMEDKYNIGRIELFNRKGHFDRLSQITVMTSNAVTPTNLSVSYEGWTNRSYQGPAYDAVGVIDFTSPIEAQHVSVVSENMAAALSLAEVVVYEYNFTSEGSAEQSHTYLNRADLKALSAIDGDLTTFSTTVEGPAAHWWRVDIRETILFRHAAIYVRNGLCGPDECSSRLNDVYFLTNENSTSVAPNTASNGGWNICYHNNTATGDSYGRGCTRGSLTPVTRLFSIYTGSGYGVELREVEIYGDALPQLNMDIDGRTDSFAYTELTGSFIKWNQTMRGTVPPSKYRVSLGNLTKTVDHINETSARVSIQWTGLEQGKSFNITIQCQIEGVDCPGPQPIFTAMTKACTAPDQPKPFIHAVEAIVGGKKKWRYVANWTEPTPNCNGPLSYRYSINGQGNETTTNKHVTFYVDGYTEVTFELAAVNSINMSSNKVIYQNTSMQIVPQFGSAKLSLTSTNASCVELVWKEPEYRGGPISQYQYTCGSANFLTTSNDTLTAQSCGHRPNTNITCSLIANNAAGNSTPLNKTVTTQCDVPDEPSLNLLGYKCNQTNVAVQLSFGETNLKCDHLDHYMVTVEKENQTIKTLIKSNSSYFNITGLDPFTNYTFTVTITNNKNLSSTSTQTFLTQEIQQPSAPTLHEIKPVNNSCVYISASTPLHQNCRITHYNFICAYGDVSKSSLEEVKNHQSTISATLCGFPTGTEATCTVAANNSAGFSAAAAYSSITLPVIAATPDTNSEFPVGGIAGAAVGGVVVLTASLAVLIYFLRRNSAKEKQAPDNSFSAIVKPKPKPKPKQKPKPKPTKSAGIEMDERHEVPSAPIAEVENIYSNENTASDVRSERIAVDKLRWYNSTNLPAIKTQYHDLEQLPKPDMSIAMLPENQGKCRYKDLYSSNEHRVKLVRDDGQGTDFVNASYMKGYFGDNQYIASHGPFSDDTMQDFWLMIWQQHPSAIVMVTKAIERDKMKSLQYWPLLVGNSCQHGDINVTLTSTESWSDFSFNKLTVTKGGKTRNIPHFSYSGWPDHGVPDLEVFITFHRLINSTTTRTERQPLLVHCSAGVGRTGTYIALDYLIDQAKNEGFVDMFACAKEMRSRRPCMLQTEDQYIFLHHVLQEYLTTERFYCPSVGLDAKLSHHLNSARGKPDLISEEYEHIYDRVMAANLTYNLGQDPDNRYKNRFSAILPCDQHMAYLSDGAHGNYINAVFVDSYRAKKQWLSTQLPLEKTLTDFWQLVLEQDIQIIVQLEPSQKPFYPTMEKSMLTVDNFNITRISAADDIHTITIKLDMQHNQTSTQVAVLVVKEWPADDLPASDVVLSVHTAVEKLQQKASNAAMCITCLDGSSRCGLYICAHNAIEKLKAEQQVDLYNPTVLAKLRRPQFIPTIEQYAYLYQVAKDYLQTFDDYANFN